MAFRANRQIHPWRLNFASFVTSWLNLFVFGGDRLMDLFDLGA